ncbi:NAD(P)/FAD-dependent oxidoreductase [Nocardioides mangrovicus]|uniref:NAD(P)/FAD-dependent oxidoreductase n=1 Tax=Nocardioides mangrovicus TaxID=2478913 RepID=A0A3L8P3Q5_9ACTN|nr:NAD(P)/FAD-dependent oxidoreductase [Nocardioides mangrovicus]RLV49169.1 NAD(P)/FAD-dependent oxidoreductase [Nocardioides mangrovicus]
MAATTASETPLPALPALPAHVRVLIIGSGFAGLGTAIRLQESGERDFLVVEKGSDVGGTWRDNTYPGAACDVPSQLYSFSFALNPSWSRSFSPQPEIWDYLRRTAREAGVLDRFSFDTEVHDAAWDAEDRVWRVVTSAGTVTADLLVSGAGGLSEPRLPDIEGIETFEGQLFHSARWDHSADLRGQRVAVIGTGASAIQIVPKLAELASHLDVYQRTAPWIAPRPDRAYTGVEKLGFRLVPGLQRLYRAGIYWGREALVPGLTLQPRLQALPQLVARRHLERSISDPELRRKVTPQFTMGCKRMLISNDYYPALDSAHVDLVTDPIAEITPTGIRTREADGTTREREIDVLVVATGFYTTDLPIAHHIKGRDGRTLADAWAEHGMSAYKGTTVAGFPNFFQVVGPNTGQGHTSMVHIIESQIAYLLDALRVMDERGLTTLEPEATAQRRWNDRLQRRMRHTVWTKGGCSSWYLDEHGRNTTLWPMSTVAFRRLLRSFDPDAYLTSTASKGAST